jgi:hypothetical protein
LHLGITFPELNEMLKAGQSHRSSVVTVLARIPSEKSTGLLYRSLFDPPDNFAMRSTTLATLKNRKLNEEMVVGMLAHRETPVVAVGKDGREHLSRGFTSGGGAFSQITGRFSQLPLSEVKAFRFQARPYRWVEFRNVSLGPGQPTQVEIADAGDK